MTIIQLARQIGASIVGAIVLVVLAAAFYPLIPQSGPFGIRGSFEQVIPIAIASIVVGSGAVGWYLLQDMGS